MRRIASALLAVAVAVVAYVLLLHYLGDAGALLLAMPGFPIIAKSYEELEKEAYPLRAGTPETVPWWWYDTQPFAAAGTIAAIPFFQNVNPDETLSNWAGAGSLPEPMYFSTWHLMADIFSQTAPFITTTADTTGQMNNIGLLTLIGRPIITIRLSQKDYGPWPFSLLHATGGPSTCGLQGTTAAAGSTQAAINGPPDGGLRLQGAILLPPKTDFIIRLRMGLLVTPTTAQFIRIVMGGVLYRAVK